MLKKHYFGAYEIQYDTILDHDIYEYLRVTFELSRETPYDNSTVLLNGVPVGKIYLYKEKGKVKGYRGVRFRGNEEIPVNKGLPHKKLGKIAAMIISDFVQ
jgi:hypothetical protein